MYRIVWQITQDGESFVATEVRSGTYDGDNFFKNAPTKREPVTASTLEELRTKLKAPPYSVFDRLKTPPPQTVIEEWS